MKIVHFAKLPSYKARKRGKHRAIFYRDQTLGTWSGITWNTLNERIGYAACALAELGVEEQAHIGICSHNMPHAIISDFAIYQNRAVSVPLYPTLSVQQMLYIVNDANINVLFVSGQQQYDNACEVLRQTDKLHHIIVYSNHVDLHGEQRAMYFAEFLRMGMKTDFEKVVAKRQKNASEDDLAIIMYTSGTTGEPKGVMLTHGALLASMCMHDERLDILNKADTALSWLPMSHILERTWVYILLNKNVKVYLNLVPADVQQAMREVRPTVMCSVPRFWEKIAAVINDHIAHFSPLKQAIVTWALAIGKSYNIDYKRQHHSAPFWLALRYAFANQFIFKPVRKRIGIENGRLFPTAGATLDDKLTTLFHSMGIPILYGYGLTETCASVSCYEHYNYTIGSHGTLMPGVEVTIGEDNEILVKSPALMSGYYNKPDATKEAFVDGWFRTGDAGKLVGNCLYMTERLKDLFKTSNGKYIAPQQIETKLDSDAYIDQVAVIGNNRNFVTAIIVPNWPMVEQFAKKNKIRYELHDELLTNAKVLALFEQRIATAQADMAEFEKIKRFRLIRKGFSLESGELTSTLKLRRAVIQHNYQSLIDEMYR